LWWEGTAGSGTLHLLDQRLLPAREVWTQFQSVDEVARAISDMVVRGAPAIGVSAAYGMVLAARSGGGLAAARDVLARTRPTAINLFWALDRMRRVAHGGGDASPERLLDEARRIHEEDAQGNRRMGELLAARIAPGASVLTHCNAGALATGGFGTALSGIFVAHEQGKKVHVFVDETRPRLQGARLTAWELERAGVPYTLICDNMAASLMARRKVQLCVTGADRIAANGDAANKIGTYSVAVNAAHHRVPFIVAAPLSTFDLATASGQEIPIEERAGGEVTEWGAERTCPGRAQVFNPGFDVTPASLITAIVTERGEISPVDGPHIARMMAGA
jgi:methylthioribose-1-phosphate isomerase